MLLDTVTTPELEAEGLARDVIRAVQDTRKKADFDVSDRISLVLDFAAPEEAEAVASAFDAADVAGETLSLAYVVRAGGAVLTEFGMLPGESEFEATIGKNTYANVADFTVGVARIASGEAQA